jgi:hypothetical protein
MIYKGMKHLQNFALFEGSLSSYRYTFQIPTTQAELDEINNSPEMSNYNSLNSQGSVFSRVNNVFRFNKAKGLVLDTQGRYDFKISRNGTVYYGGIQIGPSCRFVFNTLTQFIDFLSIYYLSRINGLNVNFLDKFVFDGINPGDSVFNKITKNKGLFDKIIGIAKKYNPSDVIDAIVSKKESDIGTYINDPNLVTSTDSYKFLDSVYGFHEEQTNDQCLSFRNKYFTPFGLFDEFIDENSFIWGNLHRVCVGVSSDIRVKTYKALQNRVYKQLADDVNIFNKNIIKDTSPEISATIKSFNKAVLDQLESGGTDFNSSSLEPKMIDVLERIKNESPINFSRIINTLKSRNFLPNVVNHFTKDADIIKGGGLLGKFGITDDEDED